MKRISGIFIILTIISLIFSQTVLCAASDKDGYVIYHQNFADVSSLSEAGMKKGTDGEWGFSLSIREGDMLIDNYSDQKAYVIMPIINHPETYTVVFTYQFIDAVSDNAYVAFMLTCSGDKPENITSAVIRANGNCGDFGKLGNKISEKISAGEEVTVTIPIENGNLHEMQVSCGGERETLILENIVSVTPGNMGFIVRNASVAVSEIYLIKGTGYESLSGEYVQNSTALDKSANQNGAANEITAPQTLDMTRYYIAFTTFVSLSVILTTGTVLKYRKKYR